jgi:hypothetical protein
MTDTPWCSTDARLDRRDGTIDTTVGKQPTTDIQAVLTVIGRRTEGAGAVDLTNAIIPGANLNGADLGGDARSRAHYLTQELLDQACGKPKARREARPASPGRLHYGRASQVRSRDQARPSPSRVRREPIAPPRCTRRPAVAPMGSRAAAGRLSMSAPWQGKE